MSTGAAPKETLSFDGSQKQVVSDTAMVTQVVAGLLLLWGVIQIVGGPVAWWSLGAGLFSSVLMLVQGLLTAFLGLVMMAVANDFKFLGLLPRYSGNHLRNAAKNLTMFYQVQIGLAVLIALIVVIRMFT